MHLVALTLSYVILVHFFLGSLGAQMFLCNGKTCGDPAKNEYCLIYFYKEYPNQCMSFNNCFHKCAETMELANVCGCAKSEFLTEAEWRQMINPPLRPITCYTNMEFTRTSQCEQVNQFPAHCFYQIGSPVASYGCVNSLEYSEEFSCTCDSDNCNYDYNTCRNSPKTTGVAPAPTAKPTGKDGKPITGRSLVIKGSIVAFVVPTIFAVIFGVQ